MTERLDLDAIERSLRWGGPKKARLMVHVRDLIGELRRTRSHLASVIEKSRDAVEAVAARDQTIKQLHRSLDGADECYDNLHAARSRDAEARIAAALTLPDAPQMRTEQLDAIAMGYNSALLDVRRVLTGDQS